MPPPHDGNEQKPFVDLMKLKKIDNLTFESIAQPFTPGGHLPGSSNRSYGGHVYAQAAWAACQTVKDGLQLYNVVGTFLLPGQNTIPFVYRVQKIRDGRSFCTRIVHATQGSSDAICFTGLVSLKAPERGLLDVQERVDLWDKYAAVLRGRGPRSFPDVDGMDVPSFRRRRARMGGNDEFPGLEYTKASLDPYNAHRHPLDRTSLMFYRATGEIPADQPNLHLCAHLYASDRNSLYTVANNLDTGDLWKQVSSLVHSTSFHSDTKDLMFGPSESDGGPMDDRDLGRWFAKEDWTSRASNGRAMYHGKLFGPSGKQIATMTQDGLIRYSKKAEPTEEETRGIRETERKWVPREKL